MTFLVVPAHQGAAQMLSSSLTLISWRSVSLSLSTCCLLWQWAGCSQLYRYLDKSTLIF